MKNYKKYKEINPVLTINNIRKILTDLNILLLDSIAENDGIYACRVIIGNQNLDKLEIGMNGKGSSFEYALASGYAEFMEKIQNRYLYDELRTNYGTKRFLETLPDDSAYKQKLYEEDLVLDFKYDEREEYWSLDKVLNTFGEELKLLYHADGINDLKSILIDIMRIDENNVLMIPCYSEKNNEEIFVPIDLIFYAVGSNGMAAGNSEKEALLHGFCEIFERYASNQIYHKELTPPTIPIDDFIGTPVYEKIQHLKNKRGYEIIIKDCSLGKGIPVIGVIIIDKLNHLYNFKLGSSFVPHVAVDRCLNEVYQSNKGFIGLNIDFKWTNSQNHSVDKDTVRTNFHNILETGSGIWPLSILYSTPSYEYDGENPNFGLSNENDLKYCIELVKKLGFDIFIRNNSITEFPAFYIFIPGMSQVLNSKEEYEKKYGKNILDYMRTYPHLSNFTVQEAENLAEAIEARVNQGYSFEITKDYFIFTTDEDIVRLDINIFLCMLYYYAENFTKSKEYLDKYLEDRRVTPKGYYLYAMSNYISFYLIDGIPIDEVKAIMTKIYGSSLTNEVFREMSNPQNIFQNYNFPEYTKSEDFKSQDSKNIFSLLRIENKVNELAVKSRISYKQILNLE